MKKSFYVAYIKGLLDRFLGLIGLVCLSWLYLLIALIIVIDDPGPVLFRQKRAGIKRGQTITYFNILKFRTMRNDTPHDIPTHLLSNPDLWITRAGRFLRKTSLDELPQIWNIAVTHDMSIIGPRPALWNQYDLIDEREKYGANDILPGLTGWAQINGRDELDIEEKAALDGFYAKALKKSSMSGFLMDVRCLLGTIRAVASSDGVVEGGIGEMNRSSEQVSKK